MSRVSKFKKNAPKRVPEISELVNVLLAKKNFDGAERLCRNAITASNRTSGLAFFLLGRVQQTAGSYVEAAEAYRESIILLPGESSSIVNLAICLAHLGLYDEVIECGEAELSRRRQLHEPDQSHLLSLFNSLGFAYLRRDRYADAENVFMRSLELNPVQDYPLSMVGLLQAKKMTDTASGPMAVESGFPDVPARIYQIYYNDATRQSVEPLFHGLDNSDNSRPDWREYWPIRKFLLSHTLEEGVYYGFFSPKFTGKTSLSGVLVFDFIRASQAKFDVVGFSPFYDQVALFSSAFEQGEFAHPGLLDAARDFFSHIGETLLPPVVGSQPENTIFCNYFIAKAAFWRRWLEICEQLFDICETNQGRLAQSLNQTTSYMGQGVQMKVFVMERVVSFLLGKREFTCQPYPALKLAISECMKGHLEDIIKLTTLKAVASRTRNKMLEERFLEKRESLLQIFVRSRAEGRSQH